MLSFDGRGRPNCLSQQMAQRNSLNFSPAAGDGDVPENVIIGPAADKEGDELVDVRLVAGVNDLQDKHEDLSDDEDDDGDEDDDDAEDDDDDENDEKNDVVTMRL